ncbi:ribonuclease T2 family protein [Pseudomonas putida]|uniref:ribonuclease T2 family protein n=1 Tax=Pseudomonas putida TaxID=303 RepID=UPI00236735B9|nr:hypothetical protein [Pseudomonas putida]MDD2045985.1 hypothetical protein [Pseudomonas putida]
MRLSTGIAAIFALTTVSHSVFALDANEEITPSTTPYDFLIYAVTWQPSFCKLKPETSGCDGPPARFLVHGIWPYNNSTEQKTNRHPAFCNTAPSCEDKTECEIEKDTLEKISLIPEIAERVTVNPQDMFKHEWRKHGTCAGKSEAEYFADIATLWKVVAFNGPMFNQWIGKSVLFSKFKVAFPDNTSFRCFVQNDKQYLHEVFYLIDSDGKPYLKDRNLQIGTSCKERETFIPGEFKPVSASG